MSGVALNRLAQIEKDFKKPVVTNTQAWIWEATKAMGMGKAVPGFGRLLSKLNL